MNERIGGKGSGASSSSEFLRAYRISVLAGANASYKTIPKKLALSYPTTTDLLESRTQRGVLADLSGIVATDCKCPVTYTPGQYAPLEFVSINLYAEFSGRGGFLPIRYINTGELYFTDPFNPSSGGNSGLYSAKPFRQILTELSFPFNFLQSINDGKIYIAEAFSGRLLSYTIGGLGTTIVLSSSLIERASGITQDNFGNLYVSTGFGGIVKITLPNTVSTLYATPLEIRSITYGSDGNLYVITNFDGIWRFATNGSGGNPVYSPPLDDSYNDLIQANDGYLYVCGPRQNITRMNLSGGNISTFVPDWPPGGGFPVRITQGANENLYVSTGLGDNAKIYEIVVG